MLNLDFGLSFRRGVYNEYIYNFLIAVSNYEQQQKTHKKIGQHMSGWANLTIIL